jgi:hypothetical protein
VFISAIGKFTAVDINFAPFQEIKLIFYTTLSSIQLLENASYLTAGQIQRDHFNKKLSAPILSKNGIQPLREISIVFF